MQQTYTIYISGFQEFINKIIYIISAIKLTMVKWHRANMSVAGSSTPHWSAAQSFLMYKLKFLLLKEKNHVHVPVQLINF